jgi:septal ring factor EnvC (AmiA/AmiB activator)
LREEVDAVITIPPGPSETVASGEQADLGVLYETSNPVFGLAVPDRSYVLVQDLNQSIAQDVVTRNIGDVRALQEQADELNSQLEQVNLAANSLASEEARSTTADLNESLADLEETLETLQETPGETGEEASTTLEQVRALFRRGLFPPGEGDEHVGVGGLENRSLTMYPAVLASTR